MSTKVDNLVNMLDAYVADGGHHLNVNVFSRETLLDAQKHPENIRSLPSGYRGMPLISTNLRKSSRTK